MAKPRKSTAHDYTRAARALGLSANIGYRAIAEAVAHDLGQACPRTRPERDALVRHWRRPAAQQPGALHPVVAKGDRVPYEATDAFLLSYEWRRLRMAVLTKRGARCECCGATPAHGARMNVDHIKPRKLFPHLALTESNLQILCEECNHGKGNWDQTDWRARARPVDDYTPNAPAFQQTWRRR